MTPIKPPVERSRLKNVTLFGEEDEIKHNPFSVAIEKIKLPNQQPRRYFDPQKLTGLVESIKQHGILEPLMLRPLGSETYELVAGERRLRAAKQAGLKEIPVVVREMSNTDALQFALIENLQREDLNPVEETEGILQLLAITLEKSEAEVISLLHRMLDESKGRVPHNVMGNSESQTIQQVFDGTASMEWQSFVSNRLPLLKLPEEILIALREGKVAYTKAQVIARVKNEGERQALLDAAIEQELSLAQIKERIITLATATPSEKPAASLKQQFDDTYRRVRKLKVWDDPKKKKKLEKLLVELNSLVAEGER